MPRAHNIALVMSPPARPGSSRRRASTPQASKPQAPTPGACEQEAMNPGVCEPGVMNPRVCEQGAMNPGACEQEAMNPSVCEQGFFTPCLEDLLKHRGNNRAYTVIGHTDDSWEVHFEGDAIPTTITIK